MTTKTKKRRAARKLRLDTPIDDGAALEFTGGPFPYVWIGRGGKCYGTISAKRLRTWLGNSLDSNEP